MIALGAVIFLCALVHRVADKQHPACRTMRLLHTFAWIVPGGWFMQMAVMVYAGHGGLHRWLRDWKLIAHSDLEETGTFFSVNLIFDVLVFLVFATAPSPDGRGYHGYQIGCTEEEESVSGARDNHAEPQQFGKAMEI